MLKIEKTVTASPEQWEIIIEGMRNPMNSWEKMDSRFVTDPDDGCDHYCGGCELFGKKGILPPYGFYCNHIGENDHNLMMRLANGGPVHAKYRRMIPVWVTLTAPLYWWKEFDTYKVGTVANSCSTMHKIQAKEFTLEDFSCEYLEGRTLNTLEEVIEDLNYYRDKYLNWKDSDFYIDNDQQLVDRKVIWWQMIQLRPTSYNQKRTVVLNYEVLANIYISRKGHRLDEWKTLLDWIEGLPYSEIIIGEKEGPNA